MIYVVCGLIGAGKSTYSNRNFPFVSDTDEKRSHKRLKDTQIQYTKELYESGKDVAHVTCYPTPEELAFFEALPPDAVSWIWIDTSELQARKNILQRARAQDVQNLPETLAKNHELLRMFYRSSIPFRLVQVFDDGERW